MAQNMRGFGRGNDTMMMHVTPGEVQGLQALAQQYGGSLTTNPQTGLPEAGFLEDILPMLAGGLLTMIPGVGPLMAAGLVGGGTGLATGSLEKGLMAGLGAFGGASLGGALGGMATSGAGAATAATNPALAAAATNPALATNAASALGSQVIPGAATNAASALGTQAAGAAGSALTPGANALARGAGAMGGTAGVGGNVGASLNAASTMGSQAIPAAAANAASPVPGIIGQLGGPRASEFANAFQSEAGRTLSGAAGKPTALRTGLAALGASTPVLNAMQPTYEPYKKEDDFNYEGPYTPTPRTPRFRGPNVNLGDSSEFSYFDNTNPYPGFQPAPRAFADGGEVAQTEDRALRMPAADYRAGMGAEHNYNFRPVNPAPGMQMGEAASPMRGGRQSFADMIASATGKGKADTTSAPNMRKYRYDPQTQSVIDDGTYSGMGGMGGMSGMGGAGEPGGSLFPSGVNISRFASGGNVNLRDGSFVVDARTVSELGNGSSGAGQELLARHGGQPIMGPGDGVSDSIPANIGGRQRAKVARDEVKFDPEAVRRLGGGDLQRGAQKLYALMEKAQKARKAAGRGQDTKLRKALSK